MTTNQHIFQFTDDKMKIHWDHVRNSAGSFSHFVDECKDTDYDTDGGFWDDIGDWWSGEDFDYSTVDKAVGNFYKCIAVKLVNEAKVEHTHKLEDSSHEYFTSHKL